MKLFESAKIPEYIKRNFDKYKYVILVCVVGLILVLFNFGGQESTQEPEVNDEGLSDILQQTQQLESTLEELFAAIDGVGRVKVALTVKSGFEQVYAYDQNKSASKSETDASSSSQSSLVTVSGSGTQSPVVIKINYPIFLGAVVVCDGGDNSKIRLELTDAISSLTGITSNNIVISKMKD